MDTRVKLPPITAGMNMDMRVHMGLWCLGSHMPVFIHVFMCHVFRVPLRMNVIFLRYPCGVLGLCVFVIGCLSTAALAAPCSRRIREVALLK